VIKIKLLKTGIPKLDDYLNGGIPQGRSLVYYSHPGVEGEVFGMQTLYHTLENGGRGIFLTSSASADVVRSEFREYGWDLSHFEDRLLIVDAYSALIGAPSTERFTVKDPEDIDSVTQAIEEAMKTVPGGTVVIGSLSTVMDMCGDRETLEAVRHWNELASRQGNTTIYNFTVWPYPEEILKQIKTEIFNAVISISGIAERIIYGQYFAVLKVDWNKAPEKSILFKVFKPGGVKVYIPKILVTGAYNAGKSTFVHAISRKAISVDRMGTTVALDHGHIEYKGFSADIFGTPGQERFDPIVRQLSGEAMGVILVVDSTSPRDFVRAKNLLETVKSYGLPYLIIANKQDLPGALKPEEIRRHFNIPQDVPIVPAVLKDGIGAYEAFEMLIDKITK